MSEDTVSKDDYKCGELVTVSGVAIIDGQPALVKRGEERRFGETVITRSQAEDIIRDLETKILEAAISDRLDDAGSPLTWQERAEIAEAKLAAAEKALEAIRDDKPFEGIYWHKSIARAVLGGKPS